MKIEIEITDEDAACIWTNNWGEKDGKSVKAIIQDLIAFEANDFRRKFPNSVSDAVRMFSKAHADVDVSPPQPPKRHVSYLEGALAKAKTWSIHNSPYSPHTDDHKDWLSGYADYPYKLSSPNAK